MVERGYSTAGSITSEISTQSAAPGEKKRGRPRQNLLVISGQLGVLPTGKELANPDLFLSLKTALDDEVWYRSRRYFKVILPQVAAGSEIVILRLRLKEGQVQGRQKYSFLYFVPTEQAPALRDLFEQNRHLFEEKKKPEPKKHEQKGPHPLSRLKPEDVEQVVAKLRQLYGPDQPIYYRSDKDFQKLLGVSRQTINDILAIAQKNGVIAVSHREGVRGGRAFYGREEIVKALEHFGSLRQVGEGLSSTAKRLRVKAYVRQAAKLTLKEAAARLDIPATVLRGWIIEDKVDMGKPLISEEVRRRAGDFSYSRRIFDPALLEERSIRSLVLQYQESLGSLDGSNASKVSKTPKAFFNSH